MDTAGYGRVMNTATSTAPRTLTRNDLKGMHNADNWLGYGYLGERHNYLAREEELAIITPEAADAFLAEVDQVVLDDANAHGYSYDDLFEWANSKNGRWFADVVLGGAGTLEDRLHGAHRARLLPSYYPLGS